MHSNHEIVITLSQCFNGANLYPNTQSPLAPLIVRSLKPPPVLLHKEILEQIVGHSLEALVSRMFNLDSKEMRKSLNQWRGMQE